MKAPADVTTPGQSLDAAPAGRQEILRTLDAAIREAAPHLRPEICHGMIGYGVAPYQTKSGCEGVWPKVGLANKKHHVSLYICACDDDGYLVENNAARLGKVSVGKGCIRFKRLDQLNLEVAMELVKRAAR